MIVKRGKNKKIVFLLFLIPCFSFFANAVMIGNSTNLIGVVIQQPQELTNYTILLNGSFVPYTGAVGNVDLNNKNFSTGNGTINGGTIIFNGTNYNTGLGINVLPKITSGVSNVVVGEQAGSKLTSGSWNTAVGYLALRDTTTGNDNTALGEQALLLNVLGDYNTGLGYYALQYTKSSNNVGVGRYAGGYNNLGAYNTFIGTESAIYTHDGSFNTALGYQASQNNADGGFNVALGASVLNTGGGSSNVGIGYKSLYTTTGNRNVAIGDSSGRYETGSNTLYINNLDRENLTAERERSLIYGNFATLPQDQNITFNVGRMNVTGNITAVWFNGNWNGSTSFVPYTGANKNVDLGVYNITANTFQSTNWDSRLGNGARYWQVEKLDLGATGVYPMLSGYSDGALGNIGVIKDNLIVYDAGGSGISNMYFSDNDLSDIGLMQYFSGVKLFQFTNYTGNQISVLVNGPFYSKNATMSGLLLGDVSILSPKPQELMVYGSGNITNMFYVNRSIVANENVTASWFNGAWNNSGNYIPYTGADKDININLRNLTSNGSLWLGHTLQNNYTLTVLPGIGAALARGRVGILNDNPQATLHVGSGGTAGATYVSVESASNRAGGFNIRNAGQTNPIWNFFKNNDGLNTYGWSNNSNDIMFLLTQGGRFIWGNSSTMKLQYDFNGNVNVSGNITGDRYRGQISNKSDTGFYVVDMVTQDVYEQVKNITYIDSKLIGVIASNSNLTISNKGTYLINGKVAGYAGGSGEFGLSLRVNSVLKNIECYDHNHISVGNTGSFSFDCQVDLNAGDILGLYMDDHTNPPNDFTVQSANLNVVNIGN